METPIEWSGTRLLLSIVVAARQTCGSESGWPVLLLLHLKMGCIDDAVLLIAVVGGNGEDIKSDV
jgi:hypothetical protein